MTRSAKPRNSIKIRQGNPAPADPKNTPLAFLDVETTGLSPRRGDRVVEVAIARSCGGAIQETFQSLVNPERPISPGASAVNGIYDEDLADAPRFCDIAEDVLGFLNNTVIVCHNAPFDLGFISNEMQLAGRKFAAGRVLDTLLIARQYYGFRSNGLQNIARTLRISTPDAHRALGDVMTTHAVFQHFFKDLQGDRVSALDDLGASRNVSTFGEREVALPPEIEEALSSGKKLLLWYVDMDGLKSERWVTPRQIVEFRHSAYLVAFCHLRQAERQFRLDRIVKLEVEQL